MENTRVPHRKEAGAEQRLTLDTIYAHAHAYAEVVRAWLPCLHLCLRVCCAVFADLVVFVVAVAAAVCLCALGKRGGEEQEQEEEGGQTCTVNDLSQGKDIFMIDDTHDLDLSQGSERKLHAWLLVA